MFNRFSSDLDTYYVPIVLTEVLVYDYENVLILGLVAQYMKKVTT